MARRTRRSAAVEEELSGRRLKIARQIMFLQSCRDYLSSICTNNGPHNLPIPNLQEIVMSVTSDLDLPASLALEPAVKVRASSPLTAKQIDFIFELLTQELPEIEDSYMFKEAVDPLRDGAEDYYQVIPEPICLTDIHKHVTENYYSSADDLKADLDKIYLNAIRYTPDPTTPVHRAAVRLKRYIDRRWVKLPDAEIVAEEPVNIVDLATKIQNAIEHDPDILKEISQEAWKDLPLDQRPTVLDLTQLHPPALRRIKEFIVDFEKKVVEREGSPDTVDTGMHRVGEAPGL